MKLAPYDVKKFIPEVFVSHCLIRTANHKKVSGCSKVTNMAMTFHTYFMHIQYLSISESELSKRCSLLLKGPLHTKIDVLELFTSSYQAIDIIFQFFLD